jgi:hypothetical protein
LIRSKRNQSETPSDSETDDDEIEFVAGGAAIDVDGKEMIDDKGRALTKICEDEDTKDGNAQREMDELQGLTRPKPKPKQRTLATPSLTNPKATRSATGSSELPKPSLVKSNSTSSKTTHTSPSAQVIHIDEIYKRRPAQPEPSNKPVIATCPICSLENEIGAFTCIMCAHVLNPRMDSHHWSCKSAACKGSIYINAGDVGRCGVCGEVGG